MGLASRQRPRQLTITEELIALATSGQYRREKRFMDTWQKWVAVLLLGALIGLSCAVGWELAGILVDGLIEPVGRP